MTVTIWSPYRFRERLCIYGYQGAGKSTTILNILRYDLTAHAWVIDMDYSFAYDRLIATEYPDVADRVHIFSIDTEMDAYRAIFTGDTLSHDGYSLGQANADNDWLVIDPTTATWSMAQNEWLAKAYGTGDGGTDMGSMFAELRIEAAARVESGKDLKTKAKTIESEFASDKADKMQWPIINKIFDDAFYKPLHRWRGHLIMVCEADAVRRDASDEEKAAYGWIGHKPKGQKSIPFASATNLYLEQTKINEWKMTTQKDRGRALVEKVVFSDFAFTYLVEVAGWQWADDGAETTEGAS